MGTNLDISNDLEPGSEPWAPEGTGRLNVVPRPRGRVAGSATTARQDRSTTRGDLDGVRREVRSLVGQLDGADPRWTVIEPLVDSALDAVAPSVLGCPEGRRNVEFIDHSDALPVKLRVLIRVWRCPSHSGCAIAPRDRLTGEAGILRGLREVMETAPSAT